MKFKRFLAGAALVIAAVLSTGCTRIGTGEVGVRVDAYKQVQGSEIMPGSMPQTIVGDVLKFPTKDINTSLDNHKPMTADNSPLADFDISLDYGVAPNQVAEIFSKKNRSFHGTDSDGDILLMSNFVELVVKNASYKVVRQYKSLEVADNREKMEADIKEEVLDQLRKENLDKTILVNSVRIRSILPNADIQASATALVRSQNELKIKDNEVAIAKKEAERMAALANNSTQSIAFMQAQANMKIAEGIANGKVQTIVVPMDFKGMVNVGK